MTDHGGYPADRNPQARPSNDLAEWFPFVAASGVPVPRTIVVPAKCDLLYLLDGETPQGFDDFLGRLHAAARVVGYPLFLRTGQGSGKHEYADTCLVPDEAALSQHVFNLVEWSTCVDFMGLPVDTWVVRELMRVDAPFTAFRGFPVARERRYFVREGTVFGHHPYWPPSAVEEGSPSDPEWQRLLHALNREIPFEVSLLTSLTEQAAAHLPGAWSVDWLYVPGRGWVCIDLAHYETSFVWADYAAAPRDLPPKRDAMAELVATAKGTDAILQKRATESVAEPVSPDG